MTLEKLAYQWSKQCNFKHTKDSGDYKELGENLGQRKFFSGKITDIHIKQVVEAWFKEHQYFIYPFTCKHGKVCGHYTQVKYFVIVDVML